jgi:hypothetical protein
MASLILVSFSFLGISLHDYFHNVTAYNFRYLSFTQPDLSDLQTVSVDWPTLPTDCVVGSDSEHHFLQNPTAWVLSIPTFSPEDENIQFPKGRFVFGILDERQNPKPNNNYIIMRTFYNWSTQNTYGSHNIFVMSLF